MNKLNSLSIRSILTLVTFIIYTVLSLVVVILVNHTMRDQALLEAESKSLLLLNRNLATHHYFSYILKPKLFDWTAPFRPENYFDPVWMSSTYAVREIEKYFKTLTNADYSYKECAIDARSPENEADEYEQAFIRELNTNPKLIDRSEIRLLDRKPYFVVLRRGEVMEVSCLRCHSTSDKAPEDLLKLYGKEKSFNRKAGDVVSAISIRIPLAKAYQDANRFSLHLSLALLGALAVLFAINYWFWRRFLLVPLSVIQMKATLISQKTEFVGEEITPFLGKELCDLTTAFNSMSVSLRHSINNLENRVNERTADLSVLNHKLEKEIVERQAIEKMQEKLIQELQEAAAKVRDLSGLLPICAQCKKIRDDQGYWSRVEDYLYKHSHVEFTHGICPECAKSLYPEYFGDKNESDPETLG